MYNIEQSKDLLEDLKLIARLKFKEVRKSILFPALGLIIFGIIMSFSLSYSVSKKLETSDFYFFFKHCFFATIGISAILAMFFLNIRSTLTVSFISCAIILTLMFAVLVVGSDVKGAKRWIDFGFLSIQPSEMLKPFFIVMNAFILFKYNTTKIRDYLLLSISLYGLIIVLLALEPDYGMIIIYTSIFVLQLYLMPINYKYIAATLATCLVILVLFSLTFEHVRFRVKTFIGIGSGDNYQTNIAINAIKSGGIFGNGIGESALKYKLPDAHNDFIFAVIGEELGYIAYLFVMCLYFVLILSAILYVLESRYFFINNFRTILNDQSLIEEYFIARLIVMSIGWTIFLSFTINSFVSTGLIPTKGMTLPLISYGGSSTLSNSIMVGILLSITKRRFFFSHNLK